MKIKLFSSPIDEMLIQEEVNLWLQQYEDTITIEKIEYSCCRNGDRMHYSVMVVFSEKLKDIIK